MNLTSKLILHLDDDRLPLTVPAKQNDTARFVEAVLYADGRPWDIPSDATISVRYRRQDGAGNAYSTLPDGSPAGIIKGDTVLVALAKEALAVAGITTMQITVELGKEVLSAFAFLVQVQADPSAGAPAPGVPPQNEGGTVNVQPLTFTGAVKATYDGTKPVEVNIPSGGNDYSLPVATSETLGGVMPVAKTEDMTQSVGIDGDGLLWTTPSAGGGVDGWQVVRELTLEKAVKTITVTEDADGNPLSCNEFVVTLSNPVSTGNSNLYVSFGDGETETSNFTFGKAASTAKAVSAVIRADRVGGKLMVYGGVTDASNAASTMCLRKLYDLGRITQISIQGDNASLMEGATLTIYARG